VHAWVDIGAKSISLVDSMPSQAHETEARKCLQAFVTGLLPEPYAYWSQWSEPEYSTWKTQDNANDCGVLAMAAAFHRVMTGQLPPAADVEVDATCWRHLLSSFLQPNRSQDALIDALVPQFDLAIPSATLDIPRASSGGLLTGPEAFAFWQFGNQIRDLSVATYITRANRSRVLHRYTSDLEQLFKSLFDNHSKTNDGNSKQTNTSSTPVTSPLVQLVQNLVGDCESRQQLVNHIQALRIQSPSTHAAITALQVEIVQLRRLQKGISTRIASEVIGFEIFRWAVESLSTAKDLLDAQVKNYCELGDKFK
jgi:hypothetical protein